MSFYSFRLLSPEVQLYWVLQYGTYLARRWECLPLNLYHCADEGRGFFVEVSYDEGQQELLVQRSFVNSGPLADYGHGVPLPFD